MKKTVSVMSLRSIMALLVGLLVAVALIFAATALRQSSATLSRATLLAEHNRLAASCLQAVKYLAHERGYSSIVLQDENPIGGDIRRDIDESRTKADLYLNEVLTSPPDSLVAEIDLDLVTRARDAVSSIRPALERNFALHRKDRDPALAGEWLEVSNGLVSSLETLLIDISRLTGPVDAGFNRLSELRLRSLQFRNLVGLESTLFAGKVLTGGVPTFAELNALQQLRGRTVQLWQEIDSNAEAQTSPVIAAALFKVRRTLFDALRPLQNEIMFAAGEKLLTPITAKKYLEASVVALDSTFDLADGVSNAASNYTQGRLREALWQQRLALASIVGILLLAALVAKLMLDRLTRPLSDILNRIDKLLRTQIGDAAIEASNLSGNELDIVGRALSRLDEAADARLRSEQFNASILSSVPQAVIATDTDGLIRVFSPGAENMLGYSAREVIGKETPMLFHDPDELQARAENLSRELGMALAPGFGVFVARTQNSGKPDEYEWTYVRRDGSRLTVLLTTTSLRNAQGEIEGYLGVAADITERTLAAAKFARMAHYDHLTRLPNRRLLHDRLQVAITQARRDQLRLAMMLVDLDKFKPVNDQHGHSVGDLLLKTVARRMLSCLRESDTLARVGGDEFVVILPAISSENDAVRVAEKIRVELNRPFDLPGGYKVEIACSIGIAVFPDHATDEKNLSKKADDAMYIAKEKGRNRVYLLNDGLVEDEQKETGARDLSFMRMVWHRSYRCGNEIIDREHRELFDRANTLIHAAMADTGSGEKVAVALDEMISSITHHFVSEEDVLAALHYPLLLDHRHKHQGLVEQALDLRRRSERGDLRLGELVAFLSQEVVVKHMLREDRKFFPLFR